MTLTSSCDPQVEIGSVCQMTLTVVMPPNNKTNFHLEIFSSNDTRNLIIGKPSITYGSNYNIQTANDPNVELVSAYDDSRVISFLFYSFITYMFHTDFFLYKIKKKDDKSFNRSGWSSF